MTLQKMSRFSIFRKKIYSIKHENLYTIKS